MFEILFQKIEEKILIGEREKSLCRSLFVNKSLRKRHFLLREGEACKYLAFVVSGLLRSYSTDDKGSERIVQFAPEGWWISDLYSILTGEPSVYNIDALEDTEVLMLSATAYEQLMREAPAFERYFRLLMQNNLVSLQRRVTFSMSLSAEERYRQFLELYPGIAQRIPQYHIAAYLGITPESLSRLRKG